MWYLIVWIPDLCPLSYFLNNTGTDPLKIIKLPSQHSMLGYHQPASETPFKWCQCEIRLPACQYMFDFSCRQIVQLVCYFMWTNTAWNGKNKTKHYNVTLNLIYLKNDIYVKSKHEYNLKTCLYKNILSCDNKIKTRGTQITVSLIKLNINSLLKKKQKKEEKKVTD